MMHDAHQAVGSCATIKSNHNVTPFQFEDERVSTSVIILYVVLIGKYKELPGIQVMRGL